MTPMSFPLAEAIAISGNLLQLGQEVNLSKDLWLELKTAHLYMYLHITVNFMVHILIPYNSVGSYEKV